jgi:hypothetical protein
VIPLPPRKSCQGVADAAKRLSPWVLSVCAPNVPHRKGNQFRGEAMRALMAEGVKRQTEKMWGLLNLRLIFDGFIDAAICIL